MNFESAIFEGIVRHRRFEPIVREFEYRIFMMYLDLDEVPEVMNVHPLWSTRRRSPARFRRADYFGPAGRPIRNCVLEEVERQTGTRPDGPVRMLTHLRYWGVVENPVTFYYCFDRSGEKVQAVLAEVTNTPWRDKHVYVIDGGPGPNGVISSRRQKAMHVSPLMGMDHEYTLRFGQPGRKLPVHISSDSPETTVFDATLNLTRTEITAQALSRLLVTYPPMSLRVQSGIYLQAAITWLKGVRYHARPKQKPGTEGLNGDAKTEMMCPVHASSGKSTSATRELVV
ncbi:MAG: DUF1365 domain-containing protein [Solirubrobacterales bacterium]